MASSWCNDTARFDVSVVREEWGSEERQGSTEGLHLLKHWTKGQHLLVTHFTALESQRQIFQPEKWWEAQQRQPLHGMAQHNFCLTSWGLTGPCISKGKLDNKKKLHWLKSRADISTPRPPPKMKADILYMQCYHWSLPTWATACRYRKGISKFNVFYIKSVSFTVVSSN